MKATTVLNAMCAYCNDDVGDSYPKFYLPKYNRKRGTTPSKQVCVSCFKRYIEANRPEGVRVATDPNLTKDDFYGGDEP